MRQQQRPVGRGAAVSLPMLVGLVEGFAAAVLYAVGWSRAFSYDASRTVGGSVAVEPIEMVFRQDRFNNHPLFSLLEHLVYSATGSADERVLRVVPITCAALAVGLVATAVGKRFNPVAGGVAGATLAVNSLAVRHFSDVRGYSLVALVAVVATCALYRGMRKFSLGVAIVYTVAMTLAIGTHLFTFGLLVLHVLVVVGTRPPRVRPWLIPWAASLATGLLIQLPALVDGFTRPPDNRFHPIFPITLAASLLSGGPAVPGMLVLVIAGWKVLRSQPWLTWVMVGTAVMVGGAWLAGPTGLSPRFFIWLVPATAAAAGVGVARHPRLIYLAVPTIVVQLVAIAPGLTDSEVPNRIAAGFVHDSQRQGASTCALGRSRASLRAYIEVPVVWDQADLAACDMAVEAAPDPDPLRKQACQRFGFVLRLPAKAPGAVFADQPLPLPSEYAAEAPVKEAIWESTTSAALCTEDPKQARTWTLSLRPI